MPTSAGHSETKDRKSTDTTTSNTEINWINRARVTDHPHPSNSTLVLPRMIHDQFYVVSREAEIALYKHKNLTLKNQVDRLESEVESLEEKIGQLKDTIADKDRQRQQVINQYELILSSKDQAYQEARGKSNPSDTLNKRYSMATHRRITAACIAWLEQIPRR